MGGDFAGVGKRVGGGAVDLAGGYPAEGGRPLGALVVKDGRVVAAGAARSVSIPAGAERIALDGKFVMPGLINAHGHVNGVADLSTYAAYGVTTVFSLGGEPPEVFAARASQDVSSLARARVFLAGPVLAPTSPAEARGARGGP